MSTLAERARQDSIAREVKSFLPGFAFHERAARAGGERDFIASFAGDDRSHITVGLKYSADCPNEPELIIQRSGFSDSCFSMPELQKVHAVIGALLLAWRSHGGNL